MGEAKRRRLAGEAPHTRAWAIGSMTIGANNVEWFEWSGTKQDAIALQKRYLETVNVLVPVSAESYAKRGGNTR